LEQEEIWKTIIIDGEEWNYEVCNLDGKVRNTKTGRILKQRRNKKTGYCTVGLSKDGKGKIFYVHRLVATAFIPNPLNYTDVNHINEDKTDNSVENLEWLPHKENMNHGTCQQRKGKAVSETLKGHEPTNAKKVICIETGQVFDTVEDAKKWAGITGGIIKCCKGTQQTARGYHWKYVENN
jgi:hypothetical protein